MFLRRALAGFAVALLTVPAVAAPLFPDGPDSHWAKDAVAALAAKGLVEGYPDGTFKGDRAASRWETAMIVARLLAKAEQAHATFATKSELDELRKLALAFREELDALGVRVGNLEESVTRVERRVTELERITFYGHVETRMVMQSFANKGVSDNDDGRFGAGAAGTVPYLNYDSLVGTAQASPLRPQIHGILPTVDYRNGRALSSGTGFTSLAVLGLNIEVTEDIEAGAEFAAYSSQGDAVVDAYWGVSAPYLSNPFTANAPSAQSQDNAPYTRMTLDRFWLLHKPSKTRVMLGNIDKTEMDSFVYVGEGNLGVFGPSHWPGFGFQVLGNVELNEAAEQYLTYEVLGTRFGNGVRFNGTNYQNYALSGNVAFHHQNGEVQLNISRMAEEAAAGGGPLTVGLTNGINVAYGASPGWSAHQWVNPPGFYAAQLSQFHQSNTGSIGNTTDTRPISGWNGAIDNAIGLTSGGGNFGPQSQMTYGISAFHQFKLDESNKLLLIGEYGRSDYRPNRNSPYSVDGSMVRLRLEGNLLDEDLSIGVEYLSVDPTYSPAGWFGNVDGARHVDTFNFEGLFHLYDNGKYPHNREGFRFDGRYAFCEKAGAVWVKAAFLEQTSTSLYDVRLGVNALGGGAPNFPVIGFSPGFVDFVFYGFAHPNIYGAASANSFAPDLTPLENPSGSQTDYSLGGQYRFQEAGVKVAASYRRFELNRASTLTPALGGSQNRVDLASDTYSMEVSWDVSKKVTLHGGFDAVASKGHYDPSGLYNSYAIATGENDFTNIDSVQKIPNLGVDWKMAENTDLNLTLRHYDTRDKVNPNVAPGNINLGQIGSTAHAFDWSGLQVSTHLKLSF